MSLNKQQSRRSVLDYLPDKALLGKIREVLQPGAQ